ncbi:MAG: hypothetical protein AAGC67_20775 [Myxococcota bacterium]
MASINRFAPERGLRASQRALRSILIGSSLAIWVASGAWAQAQIHIDVALQENVSDGRLSAHGYDFDAFSVDSILVDKRVFVRTVGLDGNLRLTGDPGFVSRNDPTEIDPPGLAAPTGSQGLFFNVLTPPASTMPAMGGRALSYWSGSGPVTWGTTPDADEGVAIVRGSLFNPFDFVLVYDTPQPIEGFAIGGATSGGSLHEHVNFLMLPDNGSVPPAGPDNGVYATLLELSYPSYTEWIPVWLGFSAFAPAGARDATLTDLATNFQFPLCSDGIDNDKDGTIDAGGDAGCADANDMSERGAPTECDNGIDDDGDGFTDFHDLDGDGASDWRGDPSCLHPTNPREFAVVPEPGVAMALGVGVIALAGAAGRGRRRSRTC